MPIFNQKVEVKMKANKILQEYVDHVTEVLLDWCKEAEKIQLRISATNNIVPINFKSIIRTINAKLNSLRVDLKNLYFDYKDLEEEYGVKPLSFGYFHEYSIVTKDADTALSKAKEIVHKYSLSLETTKEYDIDINKYLTTKNQKAIERFETLDLEQLLNLLNDMDLLGF
jgi:hypothetical protein